MAQTKIMVALHAQDHVEGLMRVASEMARGASAEVIGLHVVEVGLALPLDAESQALDRPGKELLALAQQVASDKFRINISTRLVRAREAGPAIVREAEDQAVDLIILGYRKKTYVAKTLLGSAVEFVTEYSPCRVIVQTVPAVQARKAAA